jgi:hypothetical protein
MNNFDPKNLVKIKKKNNVFNLKQKPTVNICF